MDKQHYEAIFKEVDLDYYECDLKNAEAFFDYWLNDKAKKRLYDSEDIAIAAFHAGRMYQESLHSGALGI